MGQHRLPPQLMDRAVPKALSELQNSFFLLLLLFVFFKMNSIAISNQKNPITFPYVSDTWREIHREARFNSLLKTCAGAERSGCYLRRPSGLTGPSSDLGSGLRELQAVWAQPCRTGQAVGPTLQMSTADQTLLTRESTQASRRAPTSPALRLAWSARAALTGMFSTGFRPWKLCSM